MYLLYESLGYVDIQAPGDLKTRKSTGTSTGKSGIDQLRSQQIWHPSRYFYQQRLDMVEYTKF
jgi:hypothetical protein